MSNSSDFEFKFDLFDSLIPVSVLPFADSNNEDSFTPIQLSSSGVVWYMSTGFSNFDEKLEYHHGEQSIGEQSIRRLFNRIQSHHLRSFTMENKSALVLKIEKYEGETCTCSLCLDEITKDSDIYKLPCNHIFHARNCIGEQNVEVWIKEHNTCPYCRAKTDLPKSINDDDLDPEEILIVMSQAAASREDAIGALKKHRNVVDAILELTP